MADRIKDIVVGVVLALLAYLKPIEGELSSLMIVFTLNFIFGYLSGMIAKGENFELKKAVVCIGHATVFFVLCAAVYAIGRFKGQMEGSVQCVSFISYLVLWFYGCNILKNLKQIFKKGTPSLVCSEFPLLSHALQIYREDSIFVRLSKLHRKGGKDMMLAIIMVAAIIVSIIVFGCIIQRNDYSEEEK